MNPVIHVCLPGLPWRWLITDDTADRLPNLLALLESGIAGALPAVGPAPLADGVLATGRPPAVNGLLSVNTARADGFGQQAATVDAFQVPTVWEYLDSAGYGCTLVNLRATGLLSLRHGRVIGDQFADVRARRFVDWGIPPGTVSPVTLADEVAELRLHPEDLNVDQLAPFTACLPTSARDGSGARVCARVLSESASAHNVATHALETWPQHYLAVRYPALEQLPILLGTSVQARDRDALLWPFARLLDEFVARLRQLAPEGTRFCVTGGTEEMPFCVVQGPSVPRDRLFARDTTLYDVPAVLMALFGMRPPAGCSGRVPAALARTLAPAAMDTPAVVARPSGPLPPAGDVIARLREQGRWLVAPSRAQRAAVDRLAFQRCFMLAEHHRAENRTLKAIEGYRAGLEYEPQDTLALVRLAECHLAANQPGAAEACMNALPESSRTLPPAVLISMDAAVADGRLADASLRARDLLLEARMQPGHALRLAGCLERLSAAYQARGDWHQANVHAAQSRRVRAAMVDPASSE